MLEKNGKSFRCFVYPLPLYKRYEWIFFFGIQVYICHQVVIIDRIEIM